MRLRFRTLILTVGLLLTTTTSGANLLDPFHWHNYNPGYGAYPVNDPAYAHHYGTYRLIDDWLGYGYLRNQEGTYGHYPFRGWNWSGLGGGSNWTGGWDLGLFGWNWDWGWGMNPGGIGWNYNWGGRVGWPEGGYGSQFYQPSYPGLLNPPPAMAPVYPAPVVQVPAMQFAPQMSMGDPCCDPCMDCCDPCMGMQQVQMPVPVQTWRPVVVDQGHWQRVWVPRPMTTMVPQSQYLMPQASMMNSGCDECGGAVAPMMQGMMMPGISGDSGCCGSEGSSGMVFPGTVAPIPQQTMMMPGYSSQVAMSHYPMTQALMSGWTPQTAWAPQGQWAQQTAHMGNPYAMPAMRPREYRRYVRQFNRHSSTAMHQSPFMAGAMSPGMTSRNYGYGWQPASSPPVPVAVGNPWGTPAYPFASAHVMPSYSMPTYNSMPIQAAWSDPVMSTVMSPSSTMMAPGMNSIPVAGDIMGDHEMMAPATAGVPVIQNSFHGNVPVMRANLSRPIGTQSSNRYRSVVR
ncbi:MAG: hypothetical protein ACK58L_10180, partial [Planctomycetota bacterium]